MSTQKERIINLMEKKGIKTQDELLHRILKCFNIDSLELENTKYNSYKSNFSKMINGKRPIHRNYIIPLERILETTIDYIETGYGEANVEIENKGLRFVAKSNDYNEFEKLGTEYTKDGTRVIASSDEYQMMIIDYILEYNSTEGVKYLIEKEGLIYEWNTGIFEWNHFGVCRYDSVKLTDMIIDLNNKNLFEKVFGTLKNHYCDFKEIFNENQLRKILNNIELIDVLLKIHEFEGRERNGYASKFVFPFATKLLDLAVNDNNVDAATHILEKAVVINDEILENVLKNRQYSDIKIKENGEVCTNTNLPFALSYIIYPNPITNNKTDKRIKEALYIAYNSILKFANIESKEYFDGDYSKIKKSNNSIIKLHSKNELEYEMYELFKDKDIQIPKLISISDGIDELEPYDGYSLTSTKKYSITKEELEELAVFYKRFDDICLEEYKDKTICHNNNESGNYLFIENKLQMVANWYNCMLSDKYSNLKNLIILFLNSNMYIYDYDCSEEAVNMIFDCYKLEKNERIEVINQLINRLKKYLDKEKEQEILDTNKLYRINVYICTFEYLLLKIERENYENK